MSRLMGLYAQHLGAERQSPYASAADYEEAVARAAELLDRADFVVAGIGSGIFDPADIEACDAPKLAASIKKLEESVVW